MMKNLILVLAAAFSISLNAHAQKSAVYQNEDGAIKGYDAVAYFTEGKPVKGVKNYKVNWNGADWYFSSKKNRNEFQSNPEKYAPQYGGYCAYGTSQGHKAPTDPENAWTIVNDKLYLNYNAEVMSSWRKDRAALIPQANKNWPVIKDND